MCLKTRLVSVVLLALMSAGAFAGEGEAQYKRYCSGCHGADGAGRPNLGTALVGSAKVGGDIAGLIDVVVNGSTGTLMVAFKKNLDDRQLADIITYVRGTFGGDPATVVDAATVAASR